jgi:mono/diheme cytochrome c family protein
MGRAGIGRRIICAPVIRRIGALAVVAAGLSPLVAGCGEEVAVPESDPLHEGAVLFQERCSGCHTLEAAGARGSKPEGEIEGGERTNGPNFNSRQVSKEDALFAIRNGGFSGAIMPANIVVGEDAEVVAEFLAEYSGQLDVEE